MDDKKRTLCLVIPSLQAGGMERVMSELAGYFATIPGLEVHLVLYGIKREMFYTIPNHIVVHKPSFVFSNRWRVVHSLKTMCFLRREIKRINPHSILSFGEYWNSFVLIALLGLKIPVFVSDRCQPDKSLGRIHDRLRKWLYPRAAGIIAQTEKARDIYLRQSFNRNISVIGNPVRKIEAITKVEKENIVLTVGRLIRSKHHDKLIETFLKIPRNDWKLVIVGYDHLKQKNSEKLKKIIADQGAEDRVFLEGKQSNVEAYYLKSKIFAFTSSSEGFPNVIGEAMSAGLPVVAFDCVAGPSDMVVNGENGFLIPLFDYDQFEIKLRTLMEDEALQQRLGQNAQTAIQQFGISKIGDKTLGFLFSGKPNIHA